MSGKVNYTFDPTSPQTIDLMIQNGNARDTTNIDAFTVEYVYGAL